MGKFVIVSWVLSKSQSNVYWEGGQEEAWKGGFRRIY